MTVLKSGVVQDGKQAYFVPDEVQALGNITGATTIDVADGNIVTATLTGNVTLTLASGEIAGQRMTLIFTQDGTGSRTLTTTAFEKAGGALTLTTTAAAVDLIELQWSGSAWNEVGRSLALA